MRQINKRIYLTAAIITLLIFVLGMLLGMVIEGKRISYIEATSREQKINFESLQLQYLYLSYLSTSERTGSCPAFLTTLDRYIKDMEGIRDRLENYIKAGKIYSGEFKSLKREYIVSQLNYWILAKKTKELCETDFVTVLYFHSKDCVSCDDQGYILDYLKRMFDNKLLIFALDTDFDEEPIIPILRNTYNITTTPTIIIENEKFVGFTSKDELLKNICSVYKKKPEICKD